MGVSIKIAGVVFAKPIASLILPTLEDLVGEFAFGGSQGASLANLANPAVPATVVGAPVFGAGFVTTTATSAYVDLNVPHPAQDFTAILVSRGGIGTLGAFGTHQFLGNRYSGFDRVDGDKNYLWSSAGVRDAGTPSLPNPASPTQFVFQAGVAPLGGLAKLFIATNGVLASATATQASITPRPVLPDFTVSGQPISRSGDTAYVAIYARVLTDEEIASAYAGVKAFLAGRGVGVS